MLLINVGLLLLLSEHIRRWSSENLLTRHRKWRRWIRSRQMNWHRLSWLDLCH